MGVNAPVCLGCEELGRSGCERGPSDVGDGGVDIELWELFPPVASMEGEDGGSGERVKLTTLAREPPTWWGYENDDEIL